MHDDENQNPGDEAEEGYIEMPSEPASVDAATARREMAEIDYTYAADKAEAAAAAAFDAHVQAGAVDRANWVAQDAHSKLQAAAKEVHDRAAGLDAAADAASRAVDHALWAEGEARDTYTKAIAEGDDAAIEAAWSAVENLTTLTDAHKTTRDALRAAADAAAEDARIADDVADSAAEVAGPLGQADIRAEMAVDAYEAAHAEAGRAADAARETYNQAIDAEKAVRQTTAEAAAEDAGDVEHIEMPPEPAREQAKPPDSEAAPIEGDASSRLMDGGVGGASPIEDSRDEAFSGEEEEGEGAPDATAAADAAVGGATVGGVAVGAAGDRFSIGETIKDVSEPILGPLGEDAGDAEATAADETTDFTRIDKDFGVDSSGNVWVNQDYLANQQANQQKVEALGDAADDVGESTVDFVEGIPVIGEDIGDALRDGYDVVEDVVDHADDPVVEDVDPWG